MADGVVCKACGHHGDFERKSRGSFAIEVILWLCFLVPGIIYSFWRMNSWTEVCPKCGSADLIPTDSPLGRKLLTEIAPFNPPVVQTPKYRPTTGRKGGLAWQLGRLMGGFRKK